LTMIDAVKQYAGVDFNEIKTNEDAKKAAESKNLHVEDTETRGEILNLMLMESAVFVLKEEKEKDV